jgi:hypothetical protein
MTQEAIPLWQPIEQAAVFAYLIDGMVAGATEQYDALQEAWQRCPGLDAQTVHRVVETFTSQRERL